MNALQFTLVSALLLLQGIWAKPRTSDGDLYRYNMKSGELPLKDMSKKVVGQEYEKCECAAQVFEHPYYKGRKLTILQQNANFGNDFFHDRVDSIKTLGKCKWIFYEHCNFKGSAHVVSMGAYSSAPRWGGRGNKISSARALPPQGTTAIALFEHRNYQGRMVVLRSSNNHLPSIEFDDTISSIIVTGGTWDIYEHPKYKGSFARLGVGEYPDIHKYQIKGDTISSVRMVGDKAQVMEEAVEEELDDEDWNSDYKNSDY